MPALFHAAEGCREPPVLLAFGLAAQEARLIAFPATAHHRRE